MPLRILYHLEGLGILRVVLLGFMWPSGLTLIALFVLPAGFMLIRAILDVHWLPSRKNLQYYIHFFGILGIIGVGLFWYGTQSIIAEGEIHLLPENHTGWVLIIFNDAARKPPLYEEERRVYQIPEDGVLRTQFPPNRPSTPDGTRKYYYVTDSGERSQELISSSHSSPIVQYSGSGTGVWKTRDCEVYFHTYAISKSPVPSKELLPQWNALFDNYAREHPTDGTDKEDKNNKLALAS